MQYISYYNSPIGRIIITADETNIIIVNINYPYVYIFLLLVAKMYSMIYRN